MRCAIAAIIPTILLATLTRGAAAQIMSAPATPNAASGSDLAGWNVSYALPSGWRVGQTIGRLQMIVSNTDAGMIFLAPGMYASPQEAMADLSVFYQQMQMQAYPVEAPAMGTIAGLRSVSAMYASTDQMGRAVQGRYAALLTQERDAASALSRDDAGQMPALRAGWQQMLYNGQSTPGTSVSSGYRTAMRRPPCSMAEGYRWSSNTQVMVSASGSYGGPRWAPGDGDQGTHTVIGTRSSSRAQGQLAVDFQPATASWSRPANATSASRN